MAQDGGPRGRVESIHLRPQGCSREVGRLRIRVWRRWMARPLPRPRREACRQRVEVSGGGEPKFSRLLECRPESLQIVHPGQIRHLVPVTPVRIEPQDVDGGPIPIGWIACDDGQPFPGVQIIRVQPHGLLELAHCLDGAALHRPQSTQQIMRVRIAGFVRRALAEHAFRDGSGPCTVEDLAIGRAEDCHAAGTCGQQFIRPLEVRRRLLEPSERRELGRVAVLQKGQVRIDADRPGVEPDGPRG